MQTEIPTSESAIHTLTQPMSTTAPTTERNGGSALHAEVFSIVKSAFAVAEIRLARVPGCTFEK